MGKGSVPEDLPTFGGIYGGIASFPDTSKAIESSDCVLWLGNYPVSGSKSSIIYSMLIGVYRATSTRKILG